VSRLAHRLLVLYGLLLGGCDRGLGAAKSSCEQGDGQACFIVAVRMYEGEGKRLEACSYSQRSCLLGNKFGCQLVERYRCDK
jgi:TPR repeat protein